MCLPDEDLFVCATGHGGGAQQALFHNELLAYLTDGAERSRRVRTAAPQDRLVAYFAAVQASFDACSEPSFCNEFAGSAVVAVVADREVVIAHQGLERAYLLRDGQLRALTSDVSEAPSPAPPDMAPHTLQILSLMSLNFFAKGRASTAMPVVDRAAWAPDDVLVLITGLANMGVPNETFEALVRGAVTDGITDGARLLGTALGGLTASRESQFSLHSRCAIVMVGHAK